MLSLLQNLTTSLRTVLCLVLICLGGSAAAQTQEATEVHISDHVTRPDGALTIPLFISCGVDQGCGAFSVEITFDPDVIHVERVEQGSYLGSSVIEAENSVDGETGTIKLAAAALGEFEATESGELAILHVVGLQPGVSTLEFTAIEVGDLEGMPVSATAIDGNVTVIEEGSLQAIVELPDEAGFQCYSKPASEGESIAVIPGGAEITIFGWLEQQREESEDDANVWLSVAASRDGELIGPCWTTTQTFLVDISGKQMALDNLWDVLPRVTEDDAGTVEAGAEAGADLVSCTVRAEQRGIAVRVGPGTHRAVRSSLRVGEDVSVIGWFEDDTGNRWWKIQPDNYSEIEADRYWVASADVVTAGSCDRVAEAEPSRFVYAPPPIMPTTVPTAIPQSVPFVAAPAAPSGSSSGAPAPAEQSTGQAAPPLPPSPPTQPEPAEPEPTCYSVSLVITERNSPGDATLVPSPNCAGGKYLEGTIAAIHVWGGVDVAGGCGLSFSGWYEQLTSFQFTVVEDCTVEIGFD